MPTFGYGEDGLTFWAVDRKLHELLLQVDDPTPVDECDVYFRPSFGRSGGPNSAQFGEFDAVLRSRKHVFLIESKWDNCATPRPNVVLEEVQRLRHSIFTWLYERWIETFPPGDRPEWGRFAAQQGAAYAAHFAGKPLAPHGSLLARNLEHILTDLAVTRGKVRNLLVYFYRNGYQPPVNIITATGERIVDPAFELHAIEYAPIGQSGYFQMVG